MKLMPYKRIGEVEDIGRRGRLARLRRGRLHHRRQPLRRRRHDALPGLRGRRLRWRARSTWRRRRRSLEASWSGSTRRFGSEERAVRQLARRRTADRARTDRAAATAGPARGPLDALRRHWPEYLMEAAGLGLFMVSAGLFATLLLYPGSPVAQAVPDGMLRRGADGPDHGPDRDRDHLLALGPAVGRAHQPGGDADLLAARQGRDLGCGVLRAGAVRGRRARRAAGAGAARRRLRRPAGLLRRDRARAGRRAGRAARRGRDLLRPDDR